MSRELSKPDINLLHVPVYSNAGSINSSSVYIFGMWQSPPAPKALAKDNTTEQCTSLTQTTPKGQCFKPEENR